MVLKFSALISMLPKHKDAKPSIQNSFMIRSDTVDSNIIISSGDNGVFSPLLEIVLSE